MQNNLAVLLQHWGYGIRNALAWLSGYRALREKDHSRAIEAFSSVLDEIHDGKEVYFGAEVEALLARGFARVQLGDVRALTDFAAVRHRVPTIRELALLEGEALHRLGHPEIAREVFEVVFDQSRDEARDRICLLIIQVYFRLSEFARAAPWIDRLSLEPIRNRLRAVVLLSNGDYEGAVQAAENAIALDPGDPLNFMALARIHDLRNTGEEERVVAEGLALHPESAGLKRVLAVVRFRQSRYDEAERLAREVVQSAPELWIARDTLGVSLFALHRPEEALECFESLARDHPEWNRSNLGWATFLLGRLEESRAAHEYALTIQPEASWDNRFLAMICERLGEMEDAREYFEAAVGGTPAHEFQHYNYGGFLDRQGEIARAFEQYAAAFRLTQRGFCHYRLCDLLRTSEGKANADPPFGESLARFGDDLATSLAEHALSARRQRWVQNLLALVLLQQDTAEAGRALDLARAAVDTRTSDLVPGDDIANLLGTLGEALWQHGQKAEAVQTLEDALRHSRASRSLSILLDAYRADLRPLVVSCASVDRALALEQGDRSSSRDDFEFARPQIERYYRGLLLLEDARWGEAAAFLSGLASELPEEPEPALSLIQALGHDGDVASAVVHCDRGLERFPHDPRFWREWMALSSVDRAGIAASIAVSQRDSEEAEDPSAGSRRIADDLRWLSEKIASGTTLRLNCGGGDYTDKHGNDWSRDRFWVGGWRHGAFQTDHLAGAGTISYKSGTVTPEMYRQRFQSPIEGTEDDYLFQTNRWFHFAENRSGYSIPLPAGEYRVTLHFAEIWYRAAELRTFEVRVEDRQFIAALDVFGERGFTSVLSRQITVPVDDGLLEIDLRPKRRAYPFVSAITVEKTKG